MQTAHSIALHGAGRLDFGRLKRHCCIAHVPVRQPCSSSTLSAPCSAPSRRVAAWGNVVCHAAQKTVTQLSYEELLARLDELEDENRVLREKVQQLSVEDTKNERTSTQAVQASTPVSADVVGTASTTAKTHEDIAASMEANIVWPTAAESPPFWERNPWQQPMPLTSGAGADDKPVPKDARLHHIIHITAEMAPIAKVGGLGDVVLGLARACLDRGHNVEVMLPYYECLPPAEVEDVKHEMDFDCPKGHVWDGQYQQGTLRTSVFSAKIAGCPVLLLRPDWNASNIFRGGRIYGGSYNEAEAYLYFSRACLEFIARSGRQPHVLHLHEWQTSAVALLYWEVFHHGGLGRPRVMLTIHNMDNTGECRQDEFAITGVPGEVFATVDKALDERTIGHNPERLNLMKGAMVYSNAITTVSRTYAHESVNGGAAGWLKSTLARPDVQEKFHGVLNGIDTRMWDPSTDPLLPANYSIDRLQGKRLCKRFLQRGLGLREDDRAPLVACITRLVPQKGIHLIKHSIFRTKELGGQYVLLGSGHADGDFRGLSTGEFRDHPDVRLLIMYNERLAHMIYAAADIVVVPSMFEPCGLTQMIAMRYGAVPVVRRTGGLADTVKDVDAEGVEGNGFTFDGVDGGSLNTALDRALQYYKDKPDWWTGLMKHNMSIDVSWESSAASYVDLYNDIAAY